MKQRKPAVPRADQRDAELLARTASGDRAAFKTLYLGYYSRLFRFLFRMTRSTSVVEELVNDVMFVVWQSAGDFRGGSRVSTWILGIAYRKGLRALRQRKSRPQLFDLDLDIVDDAPGPAASVAREETQDRLRAALDQLSEEHRTVVELAYYLGFSCKEISEVVDCPVNTVKTRMFHARKRLSGLLPGLAAANRVKRQ